jgi:alpha-galactosidase
VPVDEYLRRCEKIAREFEQLRELANGDEPIPVNHTQEYAAPIIHAVASGRETIVYANMPNRGAIANLPDEAIAECPTTVDRDGLRLNGVGPLPPQLLGYIQPHLIQHELFMRAIVEGRHDHVYQAVMFDPLTAATLTLDQIVEMCDELIAAHGPLLPKLA